MPSKVRSGPAGPHPIVLYDGVCGLCNRFVQFILLRDRNAIFRFASLQSALAARILARHGANPTDLDTVYVVINHELPDECLLPRSDAPEIRHRVRRAMVTESELLLAPDFFTAWAADHPSVAGQ